MLTYILNHDIIIIGCCLGISFGIIIKVTLILIEMIINKIILIERKIICR